ncbi:MAG: carboxylating nicotinate-nucleotide diphosphorylase, partial [Candidatus Omnitrophota bacterium]
MRLPKKLITPIIQRALKEDRAERDLTTLLMIPSQRTAEAVVIANEPGILCGIDLVKEVFSRTKSKSIRFAAFKRDGASFRKNEKIARIHGAAQMILARERVALNFLAFLSGIATLTRKFVEKTKNTSAKIMDTRKTTPTLRVLEKYAVHIGGGHNHRSRLDEAVLIKDNHLRAGRFIHPTGIDEAKLKKMFTWVRGKTKRMVEIEVENINEFRSVAKYQPDRIMLDNF